MTDNFNVGVCTDALPLDLNFIPLPEHCFYMQNYPFLNIMSPMYFNML